MEQEGKPQVKEQKKDLRLWPRTAQVDQLLYVARNSGLAAHPLVKHFEDPKAPTFYQKTEDLRRLIYIEMKKHADFRNRASFLLLGMQPQPTEPAPAPGKVKSKQ